ncbi:MAG: ferritin-like fold-containing protein, partial [Phycicoccus sp.]
AVMNLALDDATETEFIVSIVRDALRTDRTAAGRLALWGRRLLGEALSQAQAVAVERDAMSALLVGGGVDLAEVGAMFTRLTTNHEKRMNRLGLAA